MNDEKELSYPEEGISAGDDSITEEKQESKQPEQDRSHFVFEDIPDVRTQDPGFPRPRFLIRPGVFFCGSIFWLECLLRITGGSDLAMGMWLARSLSASMALGVLLWLVTTLIPCKKIATGISSGVLFFLGIVTVAQICVRDFFGTYFQLAFMFDMGEQVVGDFFDEAVEVIVSHLWLFPLVLVPGAWNLIRRRKVVPIHSARNPRNPKLWYIQGGALILLQLVNILLCHTGEVQYYTTDFTANTAIPRYGLVNTLRLELEYGIFGQPEAELITDEIYLPDSAEEETVNQESVEETQENVEQLQEDTSSPTDQEADTLSESLEEEEPVVIVYDDNVLDIDFDALIESDNDGTLLAMDQYFSSQTPTSQNEYTGLFEGKNLIMICAEAFSYAAIDQERTPVLYRLANTGFVFTNYYVPDYTQSTTGGEFAFLTGLLPTWVDGKTAFRSTSGNSMPFGLGWMFSAIGYTTTACHNNSYTYYNRNLTHPNLGYDYIGIGNGLEIESADLWPSSDLEMIMATVGDWIEDYVNDGTLFHTYYMTVSGHCNYGWDKNKMSLKNQAVVEGLEGSETVLAYLACQMEVEYALEYLVNALEEAGIADDTVIVLTADHYPYAMAEGDTDYYVELTGLDTTENETARYQNTLILWSGCMDEAVEVDTPCTSIDVIPTLLNLFGMEYDSRLFSGRDILAEDVEVGSVDSNMHVAIFADTGYGYSWITAAGTYEAYTKTFTPADGVELQDEQAYVDAVTSLVQNRFTYARYVVSKDYYSHVFSDWQPGMTLLEALGLS